MSIEGILKEVDVLNGVGTSLHGLAAEHAMIADSLLPVAESVGRAATLLAVLAVAAQKG